jgi:pyruvate/2-oxoglutarate/acetoin dehydrogenase E1 component
MLACDELKKEGIDVELIDLRSVKPLDTATIIRSVRKTGHLIVVDGSWKTNSIASEIITCVHESAFDCLKSAAVRLTLPDAPAPASRTLEAAYYISKDHIINSIKNLLKK